LVTSGQVASNTVSPRASASWRTACDTPWALQILDEYRALFAQTVDNEFVVYHFVAHVNRRAMQHQCPLHDLYGTIHTRAKTARVSQQQFHAFSP
jgi:hypothetical protein